MKRLPGLLLVVSLCVPLPTADAQGWRTPRRGEFRVNSYTTGLQDSPRVAARPNGGFVVVWESDQEVGPDAPEGFPGVGRLGVFARLYNRFGYPVGGEFQVNQYTTGGQFRPTVAVAPSGEFVVVWTGYGDGGRGSGYSYGGRFLNLGGYGIFARQFAPDGTPLGGDFQVNTYTTNYQGPKTSVAMSGSGDFVVVWQSGLFNDRAPQDGSSYGVFGRQFAASGTPLGDEFQVNSYTLGEQSSPSVAAAANGDFTVVWQSVFRDGSSVGIVGQRFDADGSPRGGEFLVNTYTLGAQTSPSIAAAADGDFVVTWTSSGSVSQDGNLSGVFGQRFARSGRRRGTEFQVNSYTTGSQGNPCVSAAPDGDFVVTWASIPAFPFGIGQDGSASGVFGQAFARSGARRGSEFQVNAYTTGFQLFPCVAVLRGGDFVVTWQSEGQDGSSSGVFGRRLEAPRNPGPWR